MLVKHVDVNEVWDIYTCTIHFGGRIKFWITVLNILYISTYLNKQSIDIELTQGQISVPETILLCKLDYKICEVKSDIIITKA